MLRACWTPENDICAGAGGGHPNGGPAETQRSGFGGERRSREMSELSPEGGSEGYGAGSDEAAAPAWSSWKARSCRVLRACWTPEARNFPEAFRGEEFVHRFLQKYD